MSFCTNWQCIRLVLRQRFVGAGEIDRRQRIDQFIGSRNAHLNEAKLFRIGVEAICFGIQRDPFGGAKPRKEISQLLIRIDHGEI